MTLSLTSPHSGAEIELTFDSATSPSSFTYTGGRGGKGSRDPQYAPKARRDSRRSPPIPSPLSPAPIPMPYLPLSSHRAPTGALPQPTLRPQSAAHEEHAAYSRLLGEGPWSFGDAPISGGTSPFAFLRGGVVFTPSGPGSYAPIAGTDDLELMVGGTRHQLVVQGVIGCYQFNALRERDQRLMRGWVMMRHVSMEYTGWRDAWGCTL